MEIKPLKYKQIEGISAKQLAEHHDALYAGYANKYSEISDLLKKTDLSKANGTYSELRELNMEKSFALNGIKLHESYFDGLTENVAEPSGKIIELINRDFGSFVQWREDFVALGLCARGWVVLAYDLDSKKLNNYICDMHNQGGVWNNIALIVLDVYEHAYFFDYQTARSRYIEAYMKGIDWWQINQRLERYRVEVPDSTCKIDKP